VAQVVTKTSTSWVGDFKSQVFKKIVGVLTAKGAGLPAAPLLGIYAPWVLALYT
jgi:hypothetical protein